MANSKFTRSTGSLALDKSVKSAIKHMLVQPPKPAPSKPAPPPKPVKREPGK